MLCCNITTMKPSSVYFRDCQKHSRFQSRLWRFPLTNQVIQPQVLYLGFSKTVGTVDASLTIPRAGFPKVGSADGGYITVRLNSSRRGQGLFRDLGRTLGETCGQGARPPDFAVAACAAHPGGGTLRLDMCGSVRGRRRGRLLR